MSERTFTVIETANTTLTTTSETVVATLSGVTVPKGGDIVTLRGKVQVTTGLGATTVTLRVRRGTAVTDPLIDEGNPVSIASAAGGTDNYSVDVDDVPGELYRGSYVLTAQQAAATGNGTALQASLTATVTT